MSEQKNTKFDIFAGKLVSWVGSKSSLIIHSIFFIGSFTLVLLGFKAEIVLLVLTTVVSLEAIYLGILVQYSVNRQAETLQSVAQDIEEVTEDVGEISQDVEEMAEDVGELQEDVEELGEDIDEIQEDVGEIQEDVDEIQEDVKEVKPKNDNCDVTASYDKLEKQIQIILEEVKQLKKDNK